MEGEGNPGQLLRRGAGLSPTVPCAHPTWTGMRGSLSSMSMSTSSPGLSKLTSSAGRAVSRLVRGSARELGRDPSVSPPPHPPQSFLLAPPTFLPTPCRQFSLLLSSRSHPQVIPRHLLPGHPFPQLTSTWTHPSSAPGGLRHLFQKVPTSGLAEPEPLLTQNPRDKSGCLSAGRCCPPVPLPGPSRQPSTPYLGRPVGMDSRVSRGRTGSSPGNGWCTGPPQAGDQTGGYQ